MLSSRTKYVKTRIVNGIIGFISLSLFFLLLFYLVNK